MTDTRDDSPETEPVDAEFEEKVQAPADSAEVTIDGEELLIMKESDILGIVE